MNALSRPEIDAVSVLLVDDDAIFCKALGRALSPLGLSVRSAHSLEAAIEALRERPAEMIVVDLFLGDTSGLEALPALRELAPSARMVIATGHPGIETCVAAMRLGARSYIAKPFDVVTLLGALLGSVETDLPDLSRTDSSPSLEKYTRDYIERAVAECGGNLSRAALKLGLHRRSLQRKLRKHPPRK